MARATMWGVAVCVLAFMVACVDAQEVGYVVYADNHDGSYLREPKLSEVPPVSVDAMSVALTSLLGLPPAIVTGEDLAAQVDSLLNPNPFSRPNAVLSLQVYGGEDFLSDAKNVEDCCCGHSHHVLPLQQEESIMGNLDNALMSVASNANGPSLVHTDLDCDRLAEVCDESCQEEALGALAGHLGGQYVQSDMPMQGRLMWDEDSQMDLVNLPERELAVEVACLVNAANGPWKMKPSSSVDEETSKSTPLHLLTGKLDSLKGLHESYGKESKIYKEGSKLLARAIGMAKKAAHSTFGNKLVSQLALLGHSAQQDSTEGVNQRRHLLQASRDVDQWLTLFMAISVGFVLVVIALISISCMFSMDIKQDTILYGKGKTD